MLSVNSFRYFLIFVDDVSRRTWLYLLKERSEISGVTKLFFNVIKKIKFFTSICMLYTDNALDYVKNDVSVFYSKNVIIHQTFCSHTSQQNVVAESKHRQF